MNQTRMYKPGKNVSTYILSSVSEITDTHDKLKCIWNKYTNSETMKIITSSEIYKTIHHNGSC